MMAFGTLNPVGRLSNGMELAYVSWPTNIEDLDTYTRQRFSGDDVEDPEYAASLDLFDSDGRLLGSLRTDGRLPSIGGPLYLTGDDVLYTFHTEPYPQVRRYAVAVVQD